MKTLGKTGYQFFVFNFLRIVTASKADVSLLLSFSKQRNRALILRSLASYTEILALAESVPN